MAKENLPINFQDDILAESMNGKRRYRVINNSDGTISLDDVTEYTQVGSDFGQAQINKTNKAVNESLSKDGDASNVTNTFAQASTRTNLSSREKLGVSLGKIHKWFTDINAALFGNTIKTQDGKAEMRSDGEGGNFTIISPQGLKWEIDAYNSQLRIICLNKNKSFSIDQTGNGYIYDILLSKSSRWASDWIVHLENLYNQLNSSLSAKNKNNLGGAVDLAGIGGNTYTFPADGYLYLKANYTRGCYVKANVFGKNGANYFTVAVGSVEPNSGWNTVTNNTETVYVRAGMLVKDVQIGGNNNRIAFIPLQ